MITQVLFKARALLPGFLLYCRARFLLFFEKRYGQHSSSRKVINSLITLRVNLAKKRHDLSYFRAINAQNRNPDTILDKSLEGLFPSRRTWLALGEKTRSHLGPIERNKQILSLMVSAESRQNAHVQSSWYKNLFTAAEKLSTKMMKPFQAPLNSPQIIPVLKNAEKQLYRPIAKFALEERIRIGSAASYIRDKIDRVFLPCSYAFRAKNGSHAHCPTHHDAVADLLEYREKHKDKTLYVAECDIQKFFDILNHATVVESLHETLKRLKPYDKVPMDSRALAVFRYFLRCYTYESVASPGADKVFKEKKLVGAALDRPKTKDLMELYRHPEKVKYGVPQGGALSPVIANIVLHRADEAVYQAYGTRPREDLFYARYCDDMIIAHPQKDVCEALLDAYCKALRDLKLLVHPPQEFKKYDADFYSVKSKKPYPWAAPKPDRSHVPWVSFVGYQVGYDCSLRIRDASIKKEIEKQRLISVQTIRSIKKNGRLTEKTAHQILYRLKSKLSSMAVGKRAVNSKGPAEGMCWANGFKLLRKHPYSRAQLKQLDSARDRSVSMVRHFIKRLHSQLPRSNRDGEAVKKEYNRYFGHPFSYLGGFERIPTVVQKESANTCIEAAPLKRTKAKRGKSRL